MKPRSYQNSAVYAIWEYFRSGNNGNPIVAAPTGVGKSLMIASFIKSVLHYYPDQKILKLVHVKELITQNFDKLLTIWPTAPAGIYSAGLNRKELGNSITFAGIDSIGKHSEKLGHIDLIIIDECHLVGQKQNSVYRKLIAQLTEINPFLKVVGFTATAFRLGQGRLTEQPSIFTDVCWDTTILDKFNWYIDEGYLCSLIPKPTEIFIDTSTVGMRGGDFILKQLQQISDREEITIGAVKETIAIGGNRHHWLFYTTSIAHAENTRDILKSFGIGAEVVHSKLKPKERDQIIRSFQNGIFKALVNVDILTTGFDFPALDLIAVLRPTCSPGLWVQILGRGTRPYYADGYDLTTRDGRLAAIENSQKRDCLVLDFSRNTVKLGPINDPVIPSPKKKSKSPQPAPIKICEQCKTYIHASLRVCPHCFFLFPASTKFSSNSGTADLIARDKPKVEPMISDFRVNRVTFAVHHKTGKPDSLKVTYYCGLRRFSTWVCLWHDGTVRGLARKWWRDASPPSEKGFIQFPEDTEEAMHLASSLRVPETITVRTDLKYPEIFRYNYSN